jgi:adenylate cyclase
MTLGRYPVSSVNRFHMSRLKRKLTIILYADVAGYSRLMGLDEEGSHRQVMAILDSAADTINKSGGEVLRYAGDAILATFSSVVGAIEASIAIQGQISAVNEGVTRDRHVQIRIGLNLGDVIEDRGEVYGDGVNVAARLESLAVPGGICVSGAVAEQIREEAGVRLIDQGKVEVKNIERPVKTFHIDAVGVEVPDDSSLNESLPPQCRGLGLPLPSKPSVILMPFKDHSTAGELGYIAEGIRIDVQCALVKITGLFVIAAGTGSAVYADHDVSPQQVSREMGVQHVLEGSVRGNSDRLRLTAQLTDGTNGQVLWTEQYDRVIDDSFVVQDEITQKIITSMDVKLVSGEQAKVWRRTLRNPKALELYYRALDRLSDFDKNGVADSRHLAERVTKISPDVALGPTLVAFCHYWDATMGWSDDIEESLDRASEWAERAAAMEDATGEAHIILAHVRLLRGNHDEAESIAEDAVKIRPQCANTNALSANILVYCGKPAKAVERVKAAIRHAPAYASWWVEILAAAYRDSDQTDMAIAAAREALQLRPDSANGLALLSSALMSSGSEILAREAASQIRKVDPAYSLKNYARMHPYRDTSTLESQLAQLRQAGLSE